MTARFVFPESLRFECSRCGDCCRGVRVMLGPSEPEKLQALDWHGRADDLVNAAAVVKAEGRMILAHRADGSCVYLGEANQCRIHEHFGGNAKPLMCRLFPFGFLPVGDRIAVDVSFACKSVSEGSGRPLGGRVREWVELLGEPGDPSEHAFSRKYTIDGTLLWELEHQLLELVAEPSLTSLDRIRAIAEFMRLATTSDPRTEQARQLRSIMIQGVSKLVRERAPSGTMDKTQRAVFFHLLFLLLNPPSFELRAASPQTRRKEVERRVEAANGYELDQARPWIDNRELQSDYRTVRAVRADYLLEAGGRDLVARYFESKILGQRFMREGEMEIPFVEAVPRLLLMFPMLIWTAKAFASERGAAFLGDEDARKALRALDRGFGEVRLADLPAKQRKAWQFILVETDLPLCASLDMLAAPTT